MKLGFYHYVCKRCGRYNATCLDEFEPHPIRHKCVACGKGNQPVWEKFTPKDKSKPVLGKPRVVGGINTQGDSPWIVHQPKIEAPV